MAVGFLKPRENTRVKHKKRALLRDYAQGEYEGFVSDVTVEGVFFQATADEHHLQRGDRCSIEIEGLEGEAITLSCEARNPNSVGGVGLHIVESVSAWESYVASVAFSGSSEAVVSTSPWQIFKKRFWGLG